MKKTILITGLAGDIGRNIARIIKEEWPSTKIIGIDINVNFPHEHFADKFINGVRVTDEQFIPFIENLIDTYQIELIIPTSEIELRYFCEHRMKEIKKVPIVMADFQTMDVGFDKWNTILFLKEYGYNHPLTLNDDELHNTDKIKDIGFPAILKGKEGAGGKDVFLVHEEEFDVLKHLNRPFILQEYISDELGEYTCGLVRLSDGLTQSIIFKRTLSGDKTSYAEVVHNELIKSFLYDLALSLNLNGSINIQLRLTEDGPKVFEINPRFSSTVYFRYKLGFRDIIWAIQDKLNLPCQYNSYKENELVGKRIFRDESIIIY